VSRLEGDAVSLEIRHFFNYLLVGLSAVSRLEGDAVSLEIRHFFNYLL
jgi:hypothetical protein